MLNIYFCDQLNEIERRLTSLSTYANQLRKEYEESEKHEDFNQKSEHNRKIIDISSEAISEVAELALSKMKVLNLIFIINHKIKGIPKEEHFTGVKEYNDADCLELLQLFLRQLETVEMYKECASVQFHINRIEDRLAA